MTNTQTKRWCFTRNYSDGEDIDQVIAPFLTLDANYIIFGREVAPSTGQKHLQGYVNLKKQIRLTGLKRICPISHWEKAKGNDLQNKDYCSKGSDIYESGIPIVSGSNKRKIMEAFYDDPDEMKIADPSRYRRCLAFNMYEESQRLITFPEFTRNWQQELTEILTADADSRTIIWVCGAAGNEGKTTYAKYLALHKNYFYTRGGRSDDVLYLYSIHCKDVVFDIPRDKKEFLQYSLIETVKDRAWASHKYEPIAVIDYKYIHVVVMANFLPCVPGYCPDSGKDDHRCKLSEDRIKLIVTE